MSSILIISDNDEGNPLAFELKREGHIVKVHSRNDKLFAEGINPSRIQDPRKMMDQFDLVISYVPNYFPSQRTLGAGTFQEKIMQSGYLQDVKKVVYPEMNYVGPFPCFLTIFQTPKGGIHFGSHLLTLTYDRLCEGNRGPLMLSGSGHVLLKESKLYDVIAKPLLPLLHKVNFFGPLTFHLFLSEQQAYVNAILPTPLFLQGMSELIRQPIFKLLWSCVSGEEFTAISDELSLVTTLSCQTPTNFHYVTAQEQALPHVWYQSREGSSTVLGYVSARGATVKECQRRIQRTIGFCVQDDEVMYRSDIGNDFEKRLQWLKGAGWIA